MMPRLEIYQSSDVEQRHLQRDDEHVFDAAASPAEAADSWLQKSPTV
jgi:hypothetical protein